MPELEFSTDRVETELNANSRLNEIYDRLETVLSARPISSSVVNRGYTAAIRLIIELPGGSRAFVKAANNSATASWLRSEYAVYKQLHASFVPALLGWHDDGNFPLMVLEDLSSATWPQSWNDNSIASILSTLERIRSSQPPAGLPTLESMREDFTGWCQVSEAPQNFLGLGLCSQSWLDEALTTLVEAERNATLSGDDLLHLDVRSDNVCFDGERVILIDWNWACVGNSALDVLFWLPSLAMEGGPSPEAVVSNADSNLVALIAGFWAYRAGLPGMRADVRDLQRRQLEIALPWCARLLGLPAPTL